MSEKKKYTTFTNGSAWIRADFHLHTLSDREFTYSTDSEYPPENTFPNDFVKHLEEQNIRLGVITNHNKFNRDEFKKLRTKAINKEIYLLPGVELSVGDGANGIHTLIVFSDSWLENCQDYINQFLNVAFEGKTPDQYEHENGRSTLGLCDVLKKLEGYNRDYFIVFAHVEQPSGFWTEVDGGRITEFGKNVLFQKRTAAFQKVRTHDVPDRVCRTKVISWLGDWYPAEVEGSDCKSLDDIGKKNGETWIKTGDFTFESVKYALHDYTNRVRSEKPKEYNHSYIKSISFEGGVLDGHKIPFSPELNTLIGIRGSGKSSLLESLRYVLDISFGDKATDTDYKTRLTSHTLGSGGKAVITAVDQYGREFQISRINNEFPEVYENGTLQPGVSIRETIIRKPVYFGQKDLSSSGDGFEKDLVEKLVGESLYDLRRRKIEEQKVRVAEAVQRIKKVSDIDEKIEEYTNTQQDARFNLKKFTEYGVEDKFKKQTDFEKDGRKITQIIQDLQNFEESCTDLLAQHEDTLRNNGTYTSEINKEFFNDVMKSYSSVLEILNDFKSKTEKTGTIIQSLKEKNEKFMSLKRQFTEDFAKTRRAIEEELKQKGITSLNLEEFPQLKTKIETASKMLEMLKKQKEQKTVYTVELQEALSRLNELWHQEYQHIHEQLQHINREESSLAIVPEYKGDKKGFLDFMKSSFRGSNLRSAVLEKLTEKYSDFGAIFTDFEAAKKLAGSSTEIFSTYFMDNLESFLTYQVQNSFSILYQGKELQHHSVGQRASALILFILNQRNSDLVIIDQPEDDLDNQTIYEDVIKLIRKMKKNTQFIFATHNANFPVLGDAEQIISCRYSDGKIDTNIGSIDSPDLQKDIVEIMEGGEDAFNKRKEIYGIWKSRN